MAKRLRLEWGQDGDATVKGQFVAKLDRLTHGTVNVVGGFLYVYGGAIYSRVNALLRYNLSKKTWTQLKSPRELPIRSMHTSTLIGDGLFIFGGYSANATENITLRYDLTMNACEELECSGDIPSPRRGHCTAFFERMGEMLLFGGGSDPDTYGDLFSFSVSQRAWKRLKPKGENPEGRKKMGNVKVGLKWYIFGGIIRLGFSSKDIFVLDLAPRVPAWSKVVFAGSPPRRMDFPVVYLEGFLVMLSSTIHVVDVRTKTIEAAEAGSRSVLSGKHPYANLCVSGAFAAAVSGKAYVFTGSSLCKPHFLAYEVIE